MWCEEGSSFPRDLSGCRLAVRMKQNSELRVFFPKILGSGGTGHIAVIALIICKIHSMKTKGKCPQSLPSMVSWGSRRSQEEVWGRRQTQAKASLGAESPAPLAQPEPLAQG